jgi:hypothetical protein
MAALSLSIDEIRPLNRWNYSRIQPGSVGSIGDVNLTPRFKHSFPNLPLRFDPYFSGKNAPFLGSNVTDGTHCNYDSGGGPARTIDSNWGGRRNFKVRHGWVYQDMRQPDARTEPLLGSMPGYSWQNKLAVNYQSKRTGDKFLPLPGPYVPSPGETIRGGAYPFTRDLDPGNPVGSIIEQGKPVNENTIREFRQANGRDYQRATAGRIKNYKPGKSV